MKLFIHVGYAKCGSTSLQEGLRNGTGVFFPEAGTYFPSSEHISIALSLIGMDDYTRQYITDDWVQQQHALMINLVNESEQTVVLSSERLISLDFRQLEILKSLFPKREIEIIIIVRDREKYLSSTWRHLVFEHDYHIDYQAFREMRADFEFEPAIEKFRQFFPVHVLNLDGEKIEQQIKYLTGADLTLPESNIGVSQTVANFLQQQHIQMGSYLFKDVYTKKVKQKIREFSAYFDKPEFDEIDMTVF
jgi:hypothetical protein